MLNTYRNSEDIVFDGEEIRGLLENDYCGEIDENKDRSFFLYLRCLHKIKTRNKKVITNSHLQ